MSETSEKSADAFQQLVRMLEEAVRAGADSVGLERKEGYLILVHYRGCCGLSHGHLPKELEQALVDEIMNRAGLADKPRGEVQIRLLGKDYNVVIDQRGDFDEPAFNILLKKSTRCRK